MKPADEAIPNELLREAREKREWTQEEVSEMIGAKPNNYSRWERGITFPSPYYRKKLSKVFGKSEEDLGLVREAPLEKSLRTQISSPVQVSPTIPYADREMLLNPMLGREQEIAKILNFLQELQKRLVTITGTGGVGKTRLAREVEAELRKDSRYTTIYVSLASLPNDAYILPTIGEQLGLRQPITMEGVITALKETPASRVLVVLDNFEHVRTDENRNVLTDLLNPLTGCDKLQLLVTSRIALRTKYEQKTPLPPLEVPKLKDIEDVGDLIKYPATELYLQRAQNIKPDFLPTKNDGLFIVNVCSLLDGLPLAIELVASRIETHPPETLYQALLKDLLGLENTYYINVPKRQVSLYKTIEWSYDLLSEQEQVLFRRLVLFAAPCHIEAAEAICTLDDVPKEQVSDFLWKLNDHGLITDEDGMITFSHITIYQFALDKFVNDCEVNPESIIDLIIQFIDYYYDLINKYVMIKTNILETLEERKLGSRYPPLKGWVFEEEVIAKSPPEYAEYSRLLENEYHNIQKSSDIILLTNKMYIEENTKRIVTKEEYDTYVSIKEEIHHMAVRLKVEQFNSIIELLILLPQMGLLGDDEIEQEIELGARDALRINWIKGYRYKFDEHNKEITEINHEVAKYHHFFSTDEDIEKLEKYKRVYLCRLKLMIECAQLNSLSQFEEYFGILRRPSISNLKS